MTIVDFVRLTRANFRGIFAAFSLGLLLAFLFTLQQPVVYTATSSGYLAINANQSLVDQSTAATVQTQKVSLYASYAQDVVVARDVITQLKLTGVSPATVAGRFSAEAASDGSPQVIIFARAPEPGEARDLANAVIGAISRRAAFLESAARPEGAPQSTLVKLVPTEQATLPSTPTSPSYPRNLGIGALLGILAGYVIALVRRQLDSRIRNVDDIETLTGTAVLSIIPESEELDRVDDLGIIQSTSGQAAEALRQLRTNLRFVDVDRPPQSIVVTSANPGEGKSVVTANLARVLAAAGQKTVLIDGDLRRPMVATIFDLDPALGLTQILAGDVTVEDAVQVSNQPNLHVISAGRIPPNPSELLGSQRMQHLIQDLTGRGYLVLIDAPPLLPVTDAGLLSGIVDGSILVLAVGRTFKEQAKRSAKLMNQVGGHILGTVLNRAPVRGYGSVVYGYGFGGYTSDYYNSYVQSTGKRDWRSKAADRKRSRDLKKRAKVAAKNGVVPKSREEIGAPEALAGAQVPAGVVPPQPQDRPSQQAKPRSSSPGRRARR